MTSDWVFLTEESTSLSYYANLVTRETSWRLPPALGGPVDEPLFVRLAGGWLQFEDEQSGRSYYFHTASGLTTWIMPPEARPPPADVCDATVFELGVRAEPEPEGEEETEDELMAGFKWGMAVECASSDPGLQGCWCPAEVLQARRAAVAVAAPALTSLVAAGCGASSSPHGGDLDASASFALIL